MDLDSIQLRELFFNPKECVLVYVCVCVFSIMF